MQANLYQVLENSRWEDENAKQRLEKDVARLEDVFEMALTTDRFLVEEHPEMASNSISIPFALRIIT